MQKFSIILLFLVTVNYVVSLELFLARMLIMLDSDKSKNQFISIKKADNNKPQNVSTTGQTCELKPDTTTLGSPSIKRFYFGENLLFTWTNPLYIKDIDLLEGTVSIKYDSDKLKEQTANFKFCNVASAPKTGPAALAREIMLKIFIKQYHPTYKCLEKKTVDVGDSYNWDTDTANFAHCDVNATIRIDLYSHIGADCGLGGSGETFNYNIFRVFFNTRFEDCDGKRYLPFKDFPPHQLDAARLLNAIKVIKGISKNPIIT